MHGFRSLRRGEWDRDRCRRGCRRSPRLAHSHVVLARVLRLVLDPDEQIFSDTQGPARVAFARDVYTYLHFPLIVGVVLFAFAMKNVIAHVSNEVDWVVAFALCGGSAIYLLTYSAIRIRVERHLRLSPRRFTAAVLFLILLPIATTIPALASLALILTISVGLHTYELVRWREARAKSRAAVISAYRRPPPFLPLRVRLPTCDARFTRAQRAKERR